jgi:hypothetical protein
VRPLSKIITAKWTGDMAQVVVCLLCKHETMNSKLKTPVSQKKKKKGKEREKRSQVDNKEPSFTGPNVL